MRFTSHLDLHKTWERTFRRARLPLAYSQGFNPHPHINLASALPLGFTGDQEVIDVWLEAPLPLDEIEQMLRRAAPPGIDVRQVVEVDAKAPTLQTILEASEFEVTLLEPEANLEPRLQALVDSPALPRQRRGKDYDLRPLLLQLEPIPQQTPGDPQRFRTLLAAQANATGRPEEVLEALGIAPESARVHRTRLIFQSD